MEAEKELRTALYTRLNGMTRPVRSEAGRDEDLPYTQIGQYRWKPWETQDSSDLIAIMQFNFWSAKRSIDQVSEMQREFCELLTFTNSSGFTPLVLDSFITIRHDRMGGETLDGKDPKTGYIKQGIIEVEFWLQNKYK